LQVYPSAANFVFVELPAGVRASQVATVLEKEGILVRVCESFPGLDERGLRLAIRRPRDNDRLIQRLQTIVASRRP
ncbi:MAG: threonine-phosphate decarboxylase, partial [Nitrospirae bacterium]